MSTDFTTPEVYVTFVTQLGSKDSMENDKTKMGTMGLGLGGEAGEIAQLVADIKHAGVLSDAHRHKLLNELGDIIWYVAFGAGNVVKGSFRAMLPEYIEITDEPNVAFLDAAYNQLMYRCGLVADTVKKLLYHGKPFDEDAKFKMIGMLSDVLFAAETVARDVCGVHLQTCIDLNVEKLSVRYKGLQFTTEEFMLKEQGKNV